MSNAGGTRARDGSLEDEERIFNTLPKTVRRALAEAPYKFGPMSMFKEKVAVDGAAAVVREIKEVSRWQIRDEAERLYGRSHPQARCR